MIPLNKGIHRSPSTGVDGEMDVCVGLMPKDGEMRNVPRRKYTGVSLESGAVLLAVHHVESGDNYVYGLEGDNVVSITIGADKSVRWSQTLEEGQSVTLTATGTYKRIVSQRPYKTETVTWSLTTVIDHTSRQGMALNVPTGHINVVYDEVWISGTVGVHAQMGSGDGRRKMPSRGNSRTVVRQLRYKGSDGNAHDIAWLSEGVSGVEVMGNMLIVQSDRLYYAMWKDGGYVWLGSEFPEVDIKFRLNGDFVTTYNKDLVTVNYGGVAKKEIEVTEVVYAGNVVFNNYQAVISNLSLTSGKTYKVALWNFNLSATIYVKKTNEWERVGVTTKDSSGQQTLLFDLKYDTSQVKIFAAHVLNGTVQILETEQTDSVLFKDLDGDYGETGCNTVMGAANRFVNDYMRDKGKFIYPFLVRYAFRLFDGSYVGLSIPALMMPNSGVVPVVSSDNLPSSRSGDVDMKVYCSAVVADLQYKVSSIEDLSAWKDLITDIVVGVTPPAYTYNEGAKFNPADMPVKIREKHYVTDRNGYTGYLGGLDRPGYSRSLMSPSEVGGSGAGICGIWTVEKMVGKRFSGSGIMQFVLPAFEEDKFRIGVCERGDFHIIKSLKVDELDVMEDFATLELDEGTLTGLESRPVINEGAGMRRSLYADVVRVLNQRVLLGNVSEMADNGGMPSDMNGWCGTYTDGVADAVSVEYYAAVTDVSENGQEQTIVRLETGGGVFNTDLLWAYFPSQGAGKMRIYAKFTEGNEVTWKCAVLQLEKHKQLGGSYYFNNFESAVWEDCDEPAFASDTCYEVEGPGRVLQSNAANPFVYPVSLENDVTKGEVLALAAPTTALSQGQFGQFPLYAFCTDGIWSLSYDGAGRLSAIQAVSRERTYGKNSVVETDRQILFATSQGLKVLVGGSIQTVAPQMDGVVMTSLHRNAGSGEYIETALSAFSDLLVDDLRTWVEMLRNARFVYDYPNAALHIYPSTNSDRPIGYHYLLLLDGSEVVMVKDGEPTSWCRDMTTDLITMRDGDLTKIYEFTDDRDFDSRYKGFLLTRPVAFGDPLGMKTVDDLRLIASFAYNGEYGRVAVLVSNDRLTWWRLTSLRHHSFKWFRLAVFTEMTDAGRLQGLDVELEQRRRNKIR